MTKLKAKMGFCAVLLVVLFAAMAAMGLPDILDIHLYYTPGEALRFFAALRPEQARLYREHEFLDLAFLSTYTALFYFWAAEVDSQSGKMKVFSFIPGALDLIETGSIIAVLSGAPVQWFAGWLGVVTFLKWTSGAVLLGVLIARSVRRRREKI